MSTAGGHFSALLASSAIEPAARIPVMVLTGFLGSGKTSLLNRLLRDPRIHGTAVLVNEFGEIGIDHDLVTATHPDTILLANGCLCCAVRGDLVAALVQLAQRSQPVAQVLVETSGLADPGPIVRTLVAEASVRPHFVLSGIACTVDAVQGLATLQRHGEAARQLAVADAIFLTKTDLLDGPPPPALLQHLRALNPAAALHGHPAGQPRAMRALLRLAPAALMARQSEAAPAYRLAVQADAPATAALHDGGIRSFVIVRDEPLPREGFAAWMDMLIAMRGEDLLRVKGIVNIAEQPEQPLVIHGVQHLFAPVGELPAWPGPDRRTRIVFITRGLDVESLDESLHVLARRRRRP